jgi:hypothetical protein
MALDPKAFPQPGAELAGLQPARPRRGARSLPSPPRAAEIPGHHRVQPGRVFHGPRRRPQQLVEQGRNKPDLRAFPRRQLKEIGRLARQMIEDQYACLRGLEDRLAEAGIRRVRNGRADRPGDRFSIERFSKRDPARADPDRLSPDRPLPAPAGLRINLLVRFRRSRGRTELPPRPSSRCPRPCPGSSRFRSRRIRLYVLLEDVVRRFAGRLFPGEPFSNASRSGSPGTPTWPSARTRRRSPGRDERGPRRKEAEFRRPLWRSPPEPRPRP